VFITGPSTPPFPSCKRNPAGLVAPSLFVPCHLFFPAKAKIISTDFVDPHRDKACELFFFRCPKIAAAPFPWLFGRVSLPIKLVRGSFFSQVGEPEVLLLPYAGPPPYKCDRSSEYRAARPSPHGIV